MNPVEPTPHNVNFFFFKKLRFFKEGFPNYSQADLPLDIRLPTRICLSGLPAYKDEVAFQVNKEQCLQHLSSPTR